MGSKLIDQLELEWERLGRSRKGAEALEHWAERDREFEHFRDLDELVEFVHRRDQANAADRVLYRLVCRGLTDDLAARTVLACMMPGAKNLTSGYLWAHDNPDEAAASVLAAMWERIRTYPCQRRPAKVAANIQLDTRQRLSRKAARDAREEARRDDFADVAAVRGGSSEEPAEFGDDALGLEPDDFEEFLEVGGGGEDREIALVLGGGR